MLVGHTSIDEILCVRVLIPKGEVIYRVQQLGRLQSLSHTWLDLGQCSLVCKHLLDFGEFASLPTI